MAKEVAGQIKLQIKGGAANPSPPVGPALGSKGINIMEFCKQFNARTQDKAGSRIDLGSSEGYCSGQDGGLELFHARGSYVNGCRYGAKHGYFCQR